MQRTVTNGGVRNPNFWDTFRMRRIGHPCTWSAEMVGLPCAGELGIPPIKHAIYISGYKRSTRNHPSKRKTHQGSHRSSIKNSM